MMIQDLVDRNLGNDCARFAQVKRLIDGGANQVFACCSLVVVSGYDATILKHVWLWLICSHRASIAMR